MTSPLTVDVHVVLVQVSVEEVVVRRLTGLVDQPHGVDGHVIEFGTSAFGPEADL